MRLAKTGQRHSRWRPKFSTDPEATSAVLIPSPGSCRSDRHADAELGGEDLCGVRREGGSGLAAPAGAVPGLREAQDGNP